MAKLTYKERKHMPKKEFALPAKKEGGKGGYPINDKAHARNALARVSAYGTPAEKAKVRAAVHRKYPDIGKSKKVHGGNQELGMDTMKGRALADNRKFVLADKAAFKANNHGDRPVADCK